MWATLFAFSLNEIAQWGKCVSRDCTADYKSFGKGNEKIMCDHSCSTSSFRAWEWITHQWLIAVSYSDISKVICSLLFFSLSKARLPDLWCPIFPAVNLFNPYFQFLSNFPGRKTQFLSAREQKVCVRLKCYKVANTTQKRFPIYIVLYFVAGAVCWVKIVLSGALFGFDQSHLWQRTN